MTNERDKEDMNSRVSESYRELSAPRVPDHLNQTILRMAANKSPGKGNLLFAAWVKPVTLAATIALSLAIVLELTEVPTTAVQMEVAPAVERQAESVREDESTSDDGQVIEELVLEDTDLAKSEAKNKINSFAASSPAAALPAARKRADAAATCDEKSRQSANTWLDCIHKLSESGFALDADREYKAFILEYPAEAANSEPNK